MYLIRRYNHKLDEPEIVIDNLNYNEHFMSYLLSVFNGRRHTGGSILTAQSLRSFITHKGQDDSTGAKKAGHACIWWEHNGEEDGSGHFARKIDCVYGDRNLRALCFASGQIHGKTSDSPMCQLCVFSHALHTANISK